MSKLLDRLAKWWIRRRTRAKFDLSKGTYSSLPEDRE